MKNPRTIVSMGMMCLVVAIAWPWFSQAVNRMSRDWSDGLRGLLFGLPIGLNIMAVVQASGQRRCSSN